MMIDIRSIQKVLGSSHELKNKFISCYGKQVLTHALWLEDGEIILDKGRLGTLSFTRPGLYFYEEFLSGKTMPHRIEVSVGSLIYILTKSEFELLTRCAIPA